MTMTTPPPPPVQPSTASQADWRAPAVPASAQPPKRKMRKMTWAILIFNALMLVWMITGIVGTSTQYADCANETYQEACEAGTGIGASIAIFGLLFLTALVDMILAVIWFVTGRNRQR